MKYRTLGKTGLKVSQLGFGAMRLPMVGEGADARVDRALSTPMIHRAFEEMWGEHMGIHYYDLVARDGVGFPLAHSEVDFKSPLRFGDRPTVEITCFKVGRSSLGIHQIFRLGERVCVDAHMTVVCVKLEGLVSTPIPDAYRAKFEELLEA